jgi:uncharacterized protein
VNNLPPDIQKILDELKGEVLKIEGNGVRKIILFGSYSRGDFDEESDIDIMILVSSENVKIYDERISNTQVDLSLKYEKVLVPIFFAFEDYVLNGNIKFLYQNATKEGVVLYEAA